MITHYNIHVFVRPNDLTLEEPIENEIFELVLVEPFINY
jgi:hypothetical protein